MKNVCVLFTVSVEKSIQFTLELLIREGGESAIFNEHRGIKISRSLNPLVVRSFSKMENEKTYRSE